MNDDPLLAESAGRRWPFFVRAALVCLTICVVLCSGVFSWYLVSYRKHQAALDAIVARIRAAGDPLGGAELDKYYAIPDGEEDLTEEYLAAIRMFPQFQLSPEQQTLPIVGTAEKIPAVGEEWESRPIAEGLLAVWKPQLDALRALANRRGKVRYPSRLTDGIMAALPDVQTLRDAARRLRLEFHVRLHQGDRAGALASLRAMIRLSETLGEEPLLVSQLVRIAVFSMSVDAATEFLSSGATEEELQSLAAALGDADFARGLRRSLRGERALAYDTLQSDTSINDVLGGQNDGSPPVSMRTLSRLRPGDSARLLEIQSDLIEAADKPLPQALQTIEDLSKSFKQATIDERQSLPWNRNLLASLILPAVDASAQAFGRIHAQRDALLVAIAIERYRLKRGALPTKLDDLVPDFLASVPGDPYTGGPLCFVADEQGYAIYSVGPDGVDQGGTVVMQGAKPPDLGVRIRLSAGGSP